MKLLKLFKLLLAGIVIGVANIIPGVSGGTMAVVFGIYDQLLEVITINLKKLFGQWKFWLPVGIGMVVGILIFSKVISYLYGNFPIPTNYFFTGIILGSLPMIAKRCINTPLQQKSVITSINEEKTPVKNKDIAQPDSTKNSKKIKPSIIICCLVGIAIMIFMSFGNTDNLSSTIQTELTFGLAIWLFVAGAIAAIAMIIPGISGSFLLLILGIYGTIVNAVSELNILLLIPVALGVIAGLLGGAGFVRMLMKKVPQQTYAVIFGLVTGSIFAIFPFSNTLKLATSGLNGIIMILISVVCLVCGTILSYFQGRESKKQ